MKQKIELKQKLVMTQSLQQYLDILQISNIELEQKIGMEIIHSIDDIGYLSKSVNEIAKKVGSNTKEVEEVLLQMQKFDP